MSVRLSVVMPSFNQAEFLEEAVRSVFAQDVEGLELVVRDGASTDGSQRLLARLAAEHPGRLRWASAPDDGPAAALNAAVEAARGEFIGWLNADDLFAPGALARALACFDAHPDAVMVYGHGEHVDVGGRFLERYPTLPPHTPLAAWADGCPVCQPTVCFRRDAFLALGGLDTSLRASFDYEFWLRLQAAHPGRTRFVDAVQARTRLHAGTITSRQRERVALEGVQVVARHVGPAPAHWVLTCFDELAANHPLDGAVSGRLADRCRALAERARPWLAQGAVEEIEQRLASDQCLALSDDGFLISVEPDGWIGTTAELRLRQPQATDDAVVVGMIEVHAQHLLPLADGLRLRVLAPDGAFDDYLVESPGDFVFEIPVRERAAGAVSVWRIDADTTCSPAALDPASTDARELAFRVTGVRLRTS